MVLEIISSVTEIVDVPIGEIWAVISSFGCEKLWFPDMKSVDLKGYGIGSVRTYIFHEPGRIAWERLDYVDAENHVVRFSVFRNDLLTESIGTMKLKAVDKNRTAFTWIAEVDLPESLTKEKLQQQLDPLFKGLINAVAGSITT
ncbi:abscisic acid receptor PYL6 [Aspergillus udagawae]|uniref:Abscisic acid receptor PYL6 n=1 Tax=Aspergillus udagawae TaxID=91492 RepID=A0A8H3RSN1_9EURO|nr:abscisic acid receptor PYL6 [Aspergillus udagawae]